MNEQEQGSGLGTSSGDSDSTDSNGDEDAAGFAEDYERFKQSVETRFGQVGDAFAALGNRGTNAGQTKPPSAAPPTTTAATTPTQTVPDSSAAQGSTPAASAGGTSAPGPVRLRDAKRPKSNHWWFRDAPWKRD